ncbi:hypothetical protein PV407_21570, partial [Paenibacillus sp. GYB003]
EEPKPEQPKPATVQAIVKGELGVALLHAVNASASQLQEGVRVPGIGGVTVSVYEPNGADWYRLELSGAAYDTTYTLQFAEGIVLTEGLSPTLSWPSPEEPKPEEPKPEQPKPATVQAIVKGELGVALLHAVNASASQLQEGVRVPGIGGVTASVYEPNGADWYRLELSGAAYDTTYTLQFAEGIVLTEGLSPTLSWQSPTVTGLVYAPAAVRLSSFGATAAIQLNAKWSDGTERNVTAEASWSSADERVATVTDGIVQAAGTGSTHISAAYGGRSARIPITVTFDAYQAAASADNAAPAAGTANAIRLVVRKSDGETDTGFNGIKTVTVSGLQPAPDGSFGLWGGVTAAGTTAQAAVEFANGEAEAQLALNGASLQTLTFAVDGVVQPSAPLALAVTAASPAGLHIQTQPAGAVNGKKLATQPIVRIVDAHANPTNASVPVTASVNGLVLTGTFTVSAVNGIATFTDLGLNGVSPAVTLSFTGAGLTAAVSDPFPVEDRFTGGNGSALSPYIVTRPDQLDDIRNHLSSHFVLGSNIDLSGYAAGAGWEPIGTFGRPFAGTFDGKGYAITGLKISTANSDAGLFGSIVASAKISNIGLENANVEGGSNVGALIGYMQGGIVEDAYATGGSVSSRTGFYTGGLVGRTSSGAVLRCLYTETTVSGYNGVGGVIGSNEGSLYESFSSGAVSSNFAGLGGLVGENYGFVQQSYSRASVTGGTMNVGGLVGYNKGTVDETYAAGPVSSSASAKGGLIGFNDGSAFVTRSYYDQNAAGQSDTGKGVPLTTTQMKQQASFAGWSFGGPVPVWGIVGGDYPYLMWQR